MEGTLLGYKVLYRRGGDGEFSTITVGPNVLEANIEIGNEPGYEVGVRGYTRGGDGPLRGPERRSGKYLTILNPEGSPFIYLY